MVPNEGSQPGGGSCIIIEPGTHDLVPMQLIGSAEMGCIISKLEYRLYTSSWTPDDYLAPLLSLLTDFLNILILSLYPLNC